MGAKPLKSKEVSTAISMRHGGLLIASCAPRKPTPETSMAPTAIPNAQSLVLAPLRAETPESSWSTYG